MVKGSIDDLPLYSAVYWRRIRQMAALLNSDGCTGVPDFYKDACLEHDCHYRRGMTLGLQIITRADADRRFRQVIQSRSPFRKFSPMSWWRWLGVRIGGKAAWDRYREHEAQKP